MDFEYETFLLCTGSESSDTDSEEETSEAGTKPRAKNGYLSVSVMEVETKPRSFKGNFKTFIAANLDVNHAEWLLWGCCLCSGLVDSTIYSAYSTFVSMQTGNTIFVALGASNQNPRPYGWARSLTSIGCFTLGCFLFGRLNRLIGGKRRGTLILSFSIQLVLLVITATLVQTGVIESSRPTSTSTNLAAGAAEQTQWTQEVPIVLLSIQSAGQIVASRALGFNEMPTVVITSLLCDLVVDPELFLPRNNKRDRRVGAFVLTLAGAVAGGWMVKTTGNIWPALWLVAGIKTSIIVAWLFWRETENRRAAV